MGVQGEGSTDKTQKRCVR